MTDPAVGPDPAEPPREGNPGLVALPLVIAGGFGLGFTNTGIVNAAAAAVPILLSATAIGLLVATIWAAALNQNVNATVYGVFFGFYGSYVALSLGLTHDWFGNLTGSAAATQAGGWFVFVFVGIAVYFYAASLWVETGGRALPLGRPLIG